MAWFGTWAPRIGARCIRKDDPRHVGVIVALEGVSMHYGLKPIVAAIRWQDSGWRSNELIEDLKQPED